MHGGWPGLNLEQLMSALVTTTRVYTVSGGVQMCDGVTIDAVRQLW